MAYHACASGSCGGAAGEREAASPRAPRSSRRAAHARRPSRAYAEALGRSDIILSNASKALSYSAELDERVADHAVIPCIARTLVARPGGIVERLMKFVLRQMNRTEHPQRVVLAGLCPPTRPSTSSLARFAGRASFVARASTQQRVAQQNGRSKIVRLTSLSRPSISTIRLLESGGRCRRTARHADCGRYAHLRFGSR